LILFDPKRKQELRYLRVARHWVDDFLILLHANFDLTASFKCSAGERHTAEANRHFGLFACFLRISLKAATDFAARRPVISRMTARVRRDVDLGWSVAQVFRISGAGYR